MGGTCELKFLSSCLGGSPAEDKIPGKTSVISPDHDSRSRPNRESGFDTLTSYRYDRAPATLAGTIADRPQTAAAPPAGWAQPAQAAAFPDVNFANPRELAGD
jgi:hypothetical protein